MRQIAAPVGSSTGGGGGFRIPGVVDGWYRRPVKAWILLVLGLVMGPILLIHGCADQASDKAFDANAQTTEGRFTKVEHREERRRRRFRSNTVAYVEATFVYTVDGKRYKNTIDRIASEIDENVEFSSVGSFGDTTIKIYYDPADPADSDYQLRTSSSDWFRIGFGAVFSLLGVGLACGFLFHEGDLEDDDDE